MAVRGMSGRWRCGGIGVGVLVVLAGCDDGGQFVNPFQAQQGGGNAARTEPATSVRLVERDVEAPQVFQVTDMGLWDGRPSLGGVWVAHPDVREPERVIIRNRTNSKFVIGALFRRQRETPGPSFQVSSDAAAAIGMLAGAPAQLQVTALRREEAAPGDAPADGPDGPTPADTDPIETSDLSPVATAGAAIAAAEAGRDVAPAPQVADPVAPPDPAPQTSPTARAPSGLDKPFVQIGIFSIEQNARNTATAMRQAGLVPTVREQSARGSKFWRVIVGPATSGSERGVILDKVRGIGFEDAYAVTN